MLTIWDFLMPLLILLLLRQWGKKPPKVEVEMTEISKGGTATTYTTSRYSRYVTVLSAAGRLCFFIQCVDKTHTHHCFPRVSGSINDVFDVGRRENPTRRRLGPYEPKLGIG